MKAYQRTEPIDFVITWVDGNDPEWRKSIEPYLGESYTKEDLEKDSCRYREWGLLKYWFRAVEENAPWVRTIHVVTNGQVPSFLDTSHPKIHLVSHQDFMPPEHLPTFCSRAIEVNLHRISEIAGHFVYFNDDMYVNRRINPRFYFSKGMPCYKLVDRRSVGRRSNMHLAANRNAMEAVCRHFTPKDAPLFKRVNLKYGRTWIKTLLYYLSHDQYGQFLDFHMPSPYLKSTFLDVWAAEPELLYTTSGDKFRTYETVNQYIFRYWDLARGRFVPSSQAGGYYSVRNSTLDDCVKDILEGRSPQICLNDSELLDDFELCRDRIVEAFEKRYPRMSSYEKK